MSLENYKMFIDTEGVHHVKIFKEKEQGYENYWNFSLKGDDEPLIIKEFYTDSKFIIVNCNGWIRAFDADTKEMLLDHELKGQYNCNAVLSLDSSQLYVSYGQSSKDYLATVDLKRLTIDLIELPYSIHVKALQIRKDGSLLFYEIDYKYVNGQAIHKHFYHVLDCDRKVITKFELPHARHHDFDPFLPVIDLSNDTVIYPAYEDVLVKNSSHGETLFDFRIVFLDLNTFEIRNVLSVRDFTEDHCESIAEQLNSSERSEDYFEAVMEFYENLNSITVVEDGIWLCWRGGILRKINTDSVLSPLLVTSLLSDSTITGMFNHTDFHSKLHSIDNETIILYDYQDLYKAELPDFSFNNRDIPIPLELTKITIDDLYHLTYSDEQEEEIAEQDYIKIKIEDLSTREGIAQALGKIENVASDLKAAGIGSILKFIIKDAKGQTLHEPEFFVIAIHHNPQQVESIIRKFIKNPKVEYVYRNEEETALCYAVYELAKTRDTHLTTVLQYLACIDLDHDVFNIENTLPVLQNMYTIDGLSKKMKSISQELAEWYEYYMEEYEE